MKLYLESYGCTLSKSETALYVNKLLSEGWELTHSPHEADMSIVGTCVVIKSTEDRMVRRISDLSTVSKVKVLGCLSVMGTESLQTDSVEVVRPSEFRKFYEGKIDDVQVSEPNLWEGIPINQGCLGSCNFCISRIARGRLVSRRPEKIVNQVKMQLSRNVREVKVTSLDTAAYGRDLGINLVSLLDAILHIDDFFMLRIGMMEPKNTRELVPELFKPMHDPRVYKFLHIPVQSGSNSVLNDMNREYTVEDFVSIVDMYREEFLQGSLSTDVIVGYPGEDEGSFEQTYSLMEKIRPDIMNITRFSPRPYTKDFGRKTPSSNAVKRWSSSISELHRKITEEKLFSLIGSVHEGMVVEHGKNGTSVIRDINYRPIVVSGTLNLYSMVRTEIVDAGKTYLVGRVLS